MGRHHKDENTFKFRTFSERLSDLQIDVVRRTTRLSDVPDDESETFFSESLQKWSELNRTEHFIHFRAEIRDQVQSLPQLVYHVDSVVKVLQKHLQIEKSLAATALMDLIVHLARDLQHDFYSHFPDFFTILVAHIMKPGQDVEILEAAFTTLSFLFKIMWREMVLDMSNVLTIYAPLFSLQRREHIKRFAAESIAFVIRKVKDREHLFTLMFARVEEVANEVDGYGLVFFEMMKGVKNQLHSCTELVLPLLLTKINSSKKVLKTLRITCKALFTHADVNQIQVVWKTTMNFIDESLKPTRTTRKSQAVSMETLPSVLKLLHLMVEFEEGRTLKEQERLTGLIVAILRLPFTESCHYVIMNIITTLLENSSLQTQQIHSVVKEIFKMKDCEPSFIFNFVRKVFQATCFEQNILLPLMTYCHDLIVEQGLDDATLIILTQLILKKCPVPDCADSDQRLYILDFSAKLRTKKTSAWLGVRLMEVLNEFVTSDENSNLSKLWCALVCLPNVRPLPVGCDTTIGRVIHQLVAMNEQTGQRLPVLHQALLSLDHVTDRQPHLVVSMETMMELLKEHHNDLNVLHMMDLYTTRVSTSDNNATFDDVTGTDVLTSLKPNLSSCYRMVRLLTVRVLSKFQFVLPPHDDENVQQTSVFKICLVAEKVPLSVSDYRSKQFHLSKLEHGHVQRQLPVNGKAYDVPLRFLLGSMFNNFSLLWLPIRKMIETHAHGMSRDDFWPIYAEHLEHLAEVNERTRVEVGEKFEVANELDKLFKATSSGQWKHQDQPDHGIVRYHLWKSMQLFAPLCETKSKTLCPLFFRFLENEYYINDMNTAPKQDLRKEVPMATDVTMDDEEDDLGTEDVAKGTRPGQKKSGKKRTPITKYLVAHLEIFSKFKSPKSMTSEPQLLALYYKLLTHRYQNIQKVALDCLMTYKYKFLVPYRENLDRLLDDSHFKDEIVLFSLSEENTTIEAEHRDSLMPVLMRILYGRMISKTGKETTGKQNAALRKQLVLRFLGGCRQDELRVFMDLVFGSFKQYCSANLSEKVRDVVTEVDISNVLPVRQQQSALHTLDVVFTNLGNSIDSYLSELFHIITCVTAVSIRLLDQRQNLVAQAVNSLKTLRALGMTRITQFFTSFEKYEFAETEVDGLFVGVIWPMLEKLPNEGIYSPTALLKLIHIWSTEIKFMPLLARTHQIKQTSVLTLVFQLLLSKTAHASVTSLIMDIVENLLNSGEEELEPVRKRRPEPEVVSGPGVDVLIPHVPSIILYLHTVVKSMTSRGTRKFALPVKDIRILARLSCHVTESGQCGDIVSLLIPFLAKNAAKDESMERDILASVQHLLTKTEKPENFLWPLAKLFSIIEGRSSRRSLCDVIQAIANQNPERKKMAEIVTKLNAWDRRRVDEVDYESRLDAYVEINDHVRDMHDCDVIFLCYVIHNASYFLRHSDDMSLRDSASNCLHLLVERLGQISTSQDVYQRLVEGTLLPQIRSGLKVSNETPRNDFVKILALSVTAFPQNTVIAPLQRLMNKDDVEVDIFLNITHIQMHRRARAMRRLIQILPTSGLGTECLSLYILPIVSHYLSDAYNKHPAVIDASVDCIGAICKILPWSKYSQLLKSYLGQLIKSMAMQKVMVKVIVSVLDNFHFDICSVDDENIDKVGGIVKTVLTSVAKEKETVDGKQNDEGFEKEEEENEAEEEEVEEEETKTALTPEQEEENEAEEEEVEEEETKTALTPEQKRRIYDELLKVVVPQLKTALAKKAKSDDEHKMATKAKYAEDEEILRVPIALALVKLLQQFPLKTLKVHLPGLLMKVCEFLRSRAKDIRNTARDTLTKILTSLGHTYFPFVVAELQGALKRGYQVHVLVYTVVSLLNSMKSVLKTEMLDSSIPSIVQILNQELFGDVAQEKEVEGITNKFHEAKAIKSYDGYEILATYVGKGMIGKLLLPLKETLDSTNSHKTNKKIEEVLKRVSVGLIENKDLEVNVLMIFIHGLVNDTLPLLKTKKEAEKAQQKPGQQPPSALLLEKKTPRGGFKPKIDKKTNSNILVEFGLQLMNNLLKRSRLSVTNQEHKELLDPFVSALSEALESKHVRVTAWAMRCLTWLLDADLPSLRHNVDKVTSRLFSLLKDYAASGAAQGDNQELVMACFKVMTVLVRDVKYHTISEEQVRVLLLYVEEDIHDNSRQATAFTLLRAILIRQLMIPEMNDVMMKICKLSVTSDAAQIRQKCRQVILKFLLDYPLGKKVKNYLEFFVAQLTYDMEPGRESVLEMLASLFSNFPTSMMEAYCLLFFMPLATRLINDESTRCRKLVSLALKSLLSRVSLTKRDEIVSMLTAWSRDSKPLHQQLAMNLLGLLVEVEREKFERRVVTILPIISDRIQPDRFSDDVADGLRSSLDKVLFSSLNCLLKILSNCPSVIRSDDLSCVMNTIWTAVRSHLIYPHQWVRLASSQLFGVLFSSWTVEEVTKTTKHQQVQFLDQTAELAMRALAGDMLKQMKDFTDPESGEQIVKNLVFVAKCARRFQQHGDKIITEEEKSQRLRLDWLIRKMGREATYEATQNVKSTLKRLSVYKWLAAVSADLGHDEIPEYLQYILPPLIRDTSDLVPNMDEALKTLAQEVLDFVKTTAGVETFLRYYSDIQKDSGERRDKRKREKAIQTVSNPEISSRKRIKKNLQKRDAKKRKIAVMRPSKNTKKRKLQDLAIVDD